MMCPVPECERRIHAGGLCKVHYNRRKRRVDAGLPADALDLLVEPRPRFGEGPCRAPGCEKPRQRGKTLCSAHRSRWKRWGTLRDDDPRADKYRTPIERFVRRIAPTESGCWEWTHGLDQYGYAILGIDGRPTRAHRFAYEFFRGPYPEGLVTDHLCSNKRCVNPDHLEAVTPTENTRRWKVRTGPGPNIKESPCAPQ